MNKIGRALGAERSWTVKHLKKPKAIPTKNLVIWRWYVGMGRGSNVAIWDGKYFIYVEQKFGSAVMKYCDHSSDKGCFFPVKLLKNEYPTIGAYDRIMESLVLQKYLRMEISERSKKCHK